MALITCDGCGNQFDPPAKSCPQCGRSQPTLGNLAIRTLKLFMFVALAIIFVIVGLAAFAGSGVPAGSIFIALACLCIWAAVRTSRRQGGAQSAVGRASPEERDARKEARKQARKNIWDGLQWGAGNPALVCPHCQTEGQVRTKHVERKAGISGAKATGALLTSGLSLLATGLSRKQGCTQAHCDNCGSTWDF